MAEKANPLLALFDDKAPTDEEILKGMGQDDDNDEADDEDEDEDEDEGEETPPTKSKKAAEVDDDDDEDDDKVPDTVPKAVLLKERAKYRERLAEARGEVKGVKEATAAKPKTEEVVEEEPEVPDPVKDPAAYRAYVEEGARNMVINERMNQSERWAIKEHGQEVVDAAFEWFSKAIEGRPALANHIKNHADPYAEAVRLYKQDLRANNLKDVDDKELDSYRKWKKAKAEGKLAEWEAEQAAEAAGKGKKKKAETPPPAGTKAKKAAKPVVEEDEDDDEEDEIPPSSLAGEQAARGKDPDKVGVGAGKAFDSLFTK